MGRPKIYDSPAARKAAHRARQRKEAGLAPVISPEQQREIDRVEDAKVVLSIRRMLIARGAVELADRLYPSGHRAPSNVSASL